MRSEHFSVISSSIFSVLTFSLSFWDSGDTNVNFFFFLNIFYLFIYLFLAALGLRCCVRAFSSCSEWGLLFIAVCGLLIAVASLVAEDGL